MPDLRDRLEPLPRKVLSIEEAAAILGVSRAYGYRMAHDGRLRTIRLGRRYLVPVGALDELLAGAPRTKPRRSAASVRAALS